MFIVNPCGDNSAPTRKGGGSGQCTIVSNKSALGLRASCSDTVMLRRRSDEPAYPTRLDACRYSAGPVVNHGFASKH